MRASLCAAAIAVTACGNASSPGAPRESSAGNDARTAAAPPARASLLVMTYNVNYGVAGDAESLRLIEESGADVVTAPIAPHPLLIDVVLARYRAALEA